MLNTMLKLKMGREATAYITYMASEANNCHDSDEANHFKEGDLEQISTDFR